MQQVENHTRVRFGVFEVDLKTGELRRAGIRVRIQGQPFKVLTALLENAGEVVSREELQRRLWGTETTVDFDHSLGIAVNKLREALGDSADRPHFVETLARRGYRFIAPLTIEPTAAAAVAPGSAPGSASRSASGSDGRIPRINAADTTDTADAAHAADPARAAASLAPAQAIAEPALPAVHSAGRPGGRLAGRLAGRSPAQLPVRRLLLLSLVLSSVAVLLLAAVVLLRPPDKAAWRITRITYSGRVLEPSLDLEKSAPAVTDGTRLYFSHVERAHPVLSEALISNGEIQELKLPAEIPHPVISAVSPDHGSLLVHSLAGIEPEVPLWIVPTTGGDARRVPNVSAHDAAWMPDGRHIVFAARDALFVAQPDGSDVQKFADLPGWGFWLRWSPRGDRLRLSIRDTTNQTTSLWEMRSDGSGLKPLLSGWSYPSSECCGSWTADGRYYVFQSRHDGHSDLWMQRTSLFGRGRPTRLTNGPLDYQAPVAAPDGRRIFFIGSNPSIELLTSAGPGNFELLGGTLGSAALTAYSRDGSWVAWLNRTDGSLWRSRADGSERLQLTAGPLRVFMMRWSPDNRRLAVMAQSPGKPWKIYLIDASGGRLEPMLPEARNEADPDWSPDGRSIVFGRPPDRMAGESQQKMIQSIDLRTRQVTEIPGSNGYFSPRLSPDGRYIAAISLVDQRLAVLDRRTGAWTIFGGHSVADPQWSYDSKCLYFQDDAEEGKPIYRVRISGGAPEAVATLQSLRPLAALDYRLIALAPDDRLVVSAWTSDVNLYSVDLDQ